MLLEKRSNDRICVPISQHDGSKLIIIHRFPHWYPFCILDIRSNHTIRRWHIHWRGHGETSRLVVIRCIRLIIQETGLPTTSIAGVHGSSVSISVVTTASGEVLVRKVLSFALRTDGIATVPKQGAVPALISLTELTSP